MIEPRYGPEDRSLYWGEFHKHLTGHRRGRIASNLERAGEIIGHAKRHLDVYAPLCYPFESHRIGRADGIGVETVGQRPRFLEWWGEIESLTADHLEPDRFVTFPAYEWHGNRTRWGDHNVVYFEEGYPLDDASSITELYENLSDRRAFAIPHHTAYQANHRSKDWQMFDPELSPVVEIFSGQGSSEGVNTPVQMRNNPSMGPRTSGGTFRDGLDRGHRIGVIASNDWTGLPGSWNSGLTGIWASELTREGIWEAIESRRTYGVTGDRISLWWSVDGNPMGSVVENSDQTAATIAVECPQPLDRVDLVHNGAVAHTHNHQADPNPENDSNPENGEAVKHVLVEFGWGPDPRNDFEGSEQRWRGELGVDGGELLDVTARFSGFGQRYTIESDHRCRFALRSSRRITDDFPSSRAQVFHHRQGLILTVTGRGDDEVVLDLEGEDTITRPIRNLRDEAQVTAFTDEAERRIEAEFGVTREQLQRDSFAQDLYYSNARKVKIHPAYPRSACSAHYSIDPLPASSGTDYYYVRANQINGQYAWSSPIWVER